MSIFQNNLFGAAVFSAAAESAGGLWAWGENQKGQLGNGNTTAYSSPIQISTDTDWLSISVGGRNTFGCSFGIKDDYSLWAWGSGKEGQQGNSNGTTDYSSPVQVGSLTNWKAAINGRYFSSFLKTDGTIWNVGEGTRGQMGDGTINTRHSPVQAGSATDWVTHTIGGRAVFAINTSGELWAWGNIDMANYTITCNPTQLGSDTDWAVVDGNVVGNFSVWATKTTGKLYAWGMGTYGQLGHDNTTTILVGPGYADPAAAGQQIGTDTDWGTSQVQYAVVLGGENQRGALKTDGTIWGCGENSQGELGDGTTINRSSPVQMGDSSDWTKAHGSYRGRLAINSSGELWGWGRNGGGRLGDGTTINRSSPVQIGSDTTWTLARCGGSAALAIKSE